MRRQAELCSRGVPHRMRFALTDSKLALPRSTPFITLVTPLS
jgi:hypothetical protein